MSQVSDPINDRAQHFLKVLIERYIQDGQPVGSRTLAKDAGLDLSPATIRNVMSDLEDLGFVASPHTSAGRIPTVPGYRMFVDSLLSLRPADDAMFSQVRSELGLEETPSDLVASASKLLSGMTKMAGVVMVPKQNQVLIKQIEFIPLSKTRVLGIIVTSQGDVFNRVLETSREFSRSELEQAGNYINQHFSGGELSNIRTKILDEMKETRVTMNGVMAEALEMASSALSEEPESSDCVIAGQTNLMDFDELSQMDSLRTLFDAFTEKREILHLLDRCLDADGVQIYIGEESGYSTLKDCSIITAPYEVDKEVVGVLGVIGPTRMAYDRVIPIVDVTAKLLGAALKSK